MSDPTDRPPWATEAVVCLLARVSDRETRYDERYAALPILADALEEAGYDDRLDLNRLRRPKDYSGTTTLGFFIPRLVILAAGGKRAAAVRRLEQIAATLDLTYVELMRCADAYTDYGRFGFDAGTTTQIGSEYWRDAFSEVAKEFWTLRESVTGEAPPEVDPMYAEDRYKQNIFSCSC